MMVQPALYRSPINLTEGESGPIRLRHDIKKKGTRLPIISMRNAIVTGKKPCHVKLSEPLRIHVLEENERGIWMTDLPEELNQVGEAMREFVPRGDVLVGGLGLGILPTVLENEKGVGQVDVVEINPHVIKLCGAGHIVHQDDLLNHLRNEPDAYDCYMLDTWQSTNERCWWSTVVPLRRAIRNKHGMAPRVWCWAEDIMRGQVMRSIVNGGRARGWYYSVLPKEQWTEAQAFEFCHTVGSAKWEERYGKKLDRLVKKMKEDLVDAEV